MPLNKIILKKDIKAILTDLAERKENQDNAIDDYATAMANAIDKFVKSGDVNTTVVTTGSPAAHTGTGTGKIT